MKHSYWLLVATQCNVKNTELHYHIHGCSLSSLIICTTSRTVSLFSWVTGHW